MNQRKRHPALTALLSIAFAFACAGAAFGQQAADAKSAPATQAAPTSNTQTVNAQQSGAWAVGIDPTNNSVRLPNTTSDPLPVKVVGGAPARKPFQKRVLLTPLGTGFQTEFLPLPAGKRLVIENISVVSRCAAGQKMEINYFTYMDNGDSTSTDGITHITFHRVALTDQGSFDGVAVATANHKVLVFADEQIGNNHFQVGFQARLNGPATGFPQAQITFSGYLEDLPTAQ